MNAWRFINPCVSLIARSPFHFLISNQILVITFNGKKSGKKFLIPVSYHRHESSYTCVTLRSNIWWKNLKDKHSTQIWLRGKLVEAIINLEYKDDQIVKNSLRNLVTGNRIDAFFAKVRLNKDGSPSEEDLAIAANLHTVLNFTVN
tara:strand:+ start:2183 stop:2620 length:438 start_codon:yes stop_codon:yes gene_type:complete